MNLFYLFSFLISSNINSNALHNNNIFTCGNQSFKLNQSEIYSLTQSTIEIGYYLSSHSIYVEDIFRYQF